MDIVKKLDILIRLIGLFILGIGIYLMIFFRTLPAIGIIVSATGMSMAFFGYSKRPKIEPTAKMKIGRIIIWIAMAVMSLGIVLVSALSAPFVDLIAAMELGFALLFLGTLIIVIERRNLGQKIFKETGDRLIGTYVTIAGIAIFLTGILIFLPLHLLLPLAGCFVLGFLVVIVGALMRVLSDKPAK